MSVTEAELEAEIVKYNGIYIVSSEIKTDGHLYLTLSNGSVSTPERQGRHGSRRGDGSERR